MWDMALGAVAIRDGVVGRLTRALLMTFGAVECTASGQFRHILAVESAMTLDTIAAGDGFMHAGGIEMDVSMAFDAGLGHGRTGHGGFMR